MRCTIHTPRVGGDAQSVARRHQPPTKRKPCFKSNATTGAKLHCHPYKTNSEIPEKDKLPSYTSCQRPLRNVRRRKLAAAMDRVMAVSAAARAMHAINGGMTPLKAKPAGRRSRLREQRAISRAIWVETGPNGRRPIVVRHVAERRKLMVR
jgi:hypothetical protein